jgi:hypothetical protein
MNTTDRATIISRIAAIFDQLDERRQRELLNYAEELLQQQGE